MRARRSRARTLEGSIESNQMEIVTVEILNTEFNSGELDLLEVTIQSNIEVELHLVAELFTDTPSAFNPIQWDEFKIKPMGKVKLSEMVEISARPMISGNAIFTLYDVDTNDEYMFVLGCLKLIQTEKTYEVYV